MNNNSTTTTTEVATPPEVQPEYGQILRLRLRPRQENNSSTSVIPNPNREYLEDVNIQPWPAEIPRPSMAEVRAARLRDYGVVDATTLQSDHTVLQSALPSTFFHDPISDLSLSDLDLELLPESQNVGYLEDQISQGITTRETLELINRAQALSSADIENRQRLIGALNRDNHTGILNERLTSSDVNSFRRWGPSTIRVPPSVSRHEMVISLLFRLFSDEAIRSMGILVVSGSLSSVFVLFVLRRILIAILNPNFWAQIRLFELDLVLIRALRAVTNIPLYSPVRSSLGTSTSTPTQTSMSWVGRILEFVRLGVARFRSTFLNFQLASFNALNSRLDDFQTTLAGFIRNVRAGNYRSILYGVGINLLMLGFASLARSSFLANLLIPARDTVLRWVYASFISITGAAAGSPSSPSSTSGTPSVPVPSVPSPESPVVVRDFVADTRRILDTLTEFFMYYF